MSLKLVFYFFVQHYHKKDFHTKDSNCRIHSTHFICPIQSAEVSYNGSFGWAWKKGGKIVDDVLHLSQRSQTGFKASNVYSHLQFQCMYVMWKIMLNFSLWTVYKLKLFIWHETLNVKMKWTHTYTQGVPKNTGNNVNISTVFQFLNIQFT